MRDTNSLIFQDLKNGDGFISNIVSNTTTNKKATLLLEWLTFFNYDYYASVLTLGAAAIISALASAAYLSKFFTNKPAK